MIEPFRIAPAMPVHAYKTYAVLSPRNTHTRAATCQEVECPAYTHGWVTRVDASTELGWRQVRYLREQSGRTFTLAQEGSGLLAFTFPPGQRCFTEHRMPLDREPLYVVRDGDHRGNPTGHRVQHSSARDWLDDFSEHQEKIKKQIDKG